MPAPIVLPKGNGVPKLRPSPGQPLPFVLVDFFKKT